MNSPFWKGRKVFVTGHTGFKGSWLLLMLRELGAETHGFSLPPPTVPSMFDLLGLESACRHVTGDVRDLAALSTTLRAASPEVVIHMAAQPLVRTSYKQAVETYDVNVMGTVHLLEACRGLRSVQSIVVVTTDKCYENQGSGRAFVEQDRLGGADPYSNSKAAAELVVDGYRQSFFADGPGVASARAGNVIGGGDFAEDRLVPDAMRAFAGETPLRVRNPNAVRPWQHVLDPLAGYLMLAERLSNDPTLAGGWNFGPRADQAEPVGAVVRKVLSAWGEGAAWEADDGPHPHEAPTLALDSSKAQSRLGWQPALSLDEALRLTVDWFQAYNAGADLLAITQDQVARHFRRNAGPHDLSSAQKSNP